MENIGIIKALSKLTKSSKLICVGKPSTSFSSDEHTLIFKTEDKELCRIVDDKQYFGIIYIYIYSI